ncbi:MAG TPA: Hsp20/alpha crystallin family protein [Thermodesulfobacteriota bacterium]|nr:Hsp20/alpha crystallin family protein [Thermodesulfobacteriota bacterium]
MAKCVKKPPSASGEPSGGGKSGIVNMVAEGIEDPSGSCCEAIYVPYADVYSNRAAITTEIELPGVRHEDIDVSIFKNTINVKAVKYECFDETNITYVCMERTFGRVFRAVEIPFPVNTATINASYRNGILKIVMQRVEEKRGQPKKIPLSEDE